MTDLVLPTFALDCRDWLVSAPEPAGLPVEIDGTPVLAALSTFVIVGDDVCEAAGLLSLGLLDPDEGYATAGPDAVVRLGEGDGNGGSWQYLVPAPHGRLALLAEFHVLGPVDPVLVERIESLMASFHWAAVDPVGVTPLTFPIS